MTNAFLPSEQQSGVPFQVHHLANALVDRRIDVTVYSFSPRPADARYDTVVFPRPKLPTRYYPFFMAYRLATTDFSTFDVLHVHGDNYLISSSVPPVVRTFHGSAIDEFINARSFRRKAFQGLTVLLEDVGARRASILVGVSEATVRRIPRINNIIPCGVDLNSFRAGEKTIHPSILFVGSEDGRKRGHWFAELFKREVLPRIPNAELLMVTDGSSHERGVTRLGRVSSGELRDLYRKSWIFCLPSTYEGFGVPYIEAMASGTAVVATNGNPGAKEVLADGTYGRLVSDEDLGTEIVKLLNRPDSLAALQKLGLERSRAYSWDHIASLYERIYSTSVSDSANRTD